MKLHTLLLALLTMAALFASATAQTRGPDVIVGDLTGPQNYSSVDAGVTSAFAIGTTSCNVGDAELQWISNNNQHPVIGQNIYRVKDGVFEMVGVSWLKHGFTALQQNLCSPCNSSGTGSRLGVGCSDPYSASLNGSQGGLGPRYQVDAATGFFPYPFANPARSGNDRRILVRSDELNPALNAGARYFGEAQYVSPDDSAANNDENNASWREMRVTSQRAEGSFNMGYVGSTVRTEPAILAWPVASPTAQVTFQDIANDGRIYLGFNIAAGSNGRTRYIYAIHNLNSDRSVGGISVAMPSGFSATGDEFRNVPWHSGELYQATPWTFSSGASAVEWNTPTPHAVDQWGSAVRWGSTFTFIFESSSAPGDVTLTLFKPGTPTTITFPAFTVPQPNFESNSAEASLTLANGTNDPFEGPIRTQVGFGESTPAAIDGLAGNFFQIFTTAGAAVPAALRTSAGQIVNLDLVQPLQEFFPSFLPMPNGGINATLTAPNAALTLSAQMVLLSPANPDGFFLSACNEWRVVDSPIAVISATGGDSFNNTTNDGFWKIQAVRNGPAIVRVTLELAGSRVFDIDQGSMNGVFQCGATGGTYRLGSDATTGLVYDASNFIAACGNSGFIAIGLNGSEARGVTFRFSDFQAGETFEFDADVDAGAVTAAQLAGTSVTVELADSTVVSGVFAADPNNPQRTFVELF